MSEINLGDVVLIALGNTVRTGVVVMETATLYRGEIKKELRVRYRNSSGDFSTEFVEAARICIHGKYNTSERADFVAKWTGYYEAREYAEQLQTPVPVPPPVPTSMKSADDEPL